jgi:hypothetical protein
MESKVGPLKDKIHPETLEFVVYYPNEVHDGFQRIDTVGEYGYIIKELDSGSTYYVEQYGDEHSGVWYEVLHEVFPEEVVKTVWRKA